MLIDYTNFRPPCSAPHTTPACNRPPYMISSSSIHFSTRSSSSLSGKYQGTIFVQKNKDLQKANFRYYVIYLAGSVLVFALGVLLPLAFVIIHASLRLRNLSNKVQI